MFYFFADDEYYAVFQTAPGISTPNMVSQEMSYGGYCLKFSYMLPARSLLFSINISSEENNKMVFNTSDKIAQWNVTHISFKSTTNFTVSTSY